MSGRDLAGLSFEEARLDQANFSESVLDGARLDYASLASANLSAARLGFSSLQAADLTNASFHYADLTGADFRGARLQGTYLTNAILLGARFDNAVMSRVDVTATIGSADQFDDAQRAQLCGTPVWGDRRPFELFGRATSLTSSSGYSLDRIAKQDFPMFDALGFLYPCLRRGAPRLRPGWKQSKSFAA